MNIRRGHQVIHKPMESKDSPLLAINSFDGRSFLAGMSEISQGKGYLFVCGGDVTNKIVFRNENLKRKHLMVRDIDGCPTTVIKMNIRNLKAMMRCRCMTQFYGYLQQWLTENDIKNFYYDIWLKHHNYYAIKAQRKAAMAGKRYGKVNKKG